MSDKQSIRILAVEDNPDTQLLLRYLLREPFSLRIVTRIDAALREAAAEKYDLFLLDINLGEERTGVDLLDRLRNEPAYRSTPALALTAYAMPGDRDRFLRSGFDGYISKPFTRKELHEAIERALGVPVSS